MQRPALRSQQLCASFNSFGTCSKGYECPMAHSQQEVDAMQLRAAAAAAGSANTSEGSRVLIVPRRAGSAGAGGSSGAAPSQASHFSVYKTQLCRHYMSGSCSHGSRCNFAHGENELRQGGLDGGSGSGGQAYTAHGASRSFHHNHNNSQQGRYYKTALCNRYMKEGSCNYGSRCTFAHGEYELRPLPEQHAPNVCAYWLEGRCKNGSQCKFLHSLPAEVQQARDAGEGAYPPPPPPRPAMQPTTPPQEPQYLPQAGGTSKAQGTAGEADISALLQGTYLFGAGGSSTAGAGGSGYAVAATSAPSTAWQQQQKQGDAASTLFPPANGDAGGSSNGSGSSSAAQPRHEIDAAMRDLLHRRFNSLLCPITLEPFVDPVVAADGNVYERSSIENWLYTDRRDTSPLTNERLGHKMLMPCGTVRRCMEEVLQFVVAMRQQVL